MTIELDAFAKHLAARLKKGELVSPGEIVQFALASTHDRKTVYKRVLEELKAQNIDSPVARGIRARLNDNIRILERHEPAPKPKKEIVPRSTRVYQAKTLEERRVFNRKSKDKGKGVKFAALAEAYVLLREEAGLSHEQARKAAFKTVNLSRGGTGFLSEAAREAALIARHRPLGKRLFEKNNKLAKKKRKPRGY